MGFSSMMMLGKTTTSSAAVAQTLDLSHPSVGAGGWSRESLPDA
jgi:hypothetical protein